MSNRKHIDDFFREKLGNYRETPPPEAWDELEVRLDDLTPIVPGKPYKWIWHLGIISLLLVLGVSAGRNLFKSYAPAGNNDLATNGNAAPQNAVPAATTGAIEAVTAQGAAKQPGNGAETNDPNSTNSNSGNNASAATAGNPGLLQQQTGTGNNNSNSRITALTYNRHNSATAANKKAGRSKAGGRHSQPMVYGKHGNGLWSANQPQAKSNYNGNIPNPSAAPAANNDLNVSKASPDLPLSSISDPGAPAPGKSKADAPGTPQGSVPGKKDPEAKAKRIFSDRIEAGLKFGFEQGVAKGGASKAVIAPYLQYNLSKNLALMTQPAVKYASVSGQSAGNTQSYYQANNDGNLRGTSKPIYQTLGGGDSTIYGYATTFTYSQSHDSIVKSYRYQGSYMELELPILLKYKLSDKVAVYGGANIVYNKFNGYTEKTYTSKGIVRTVTQIDTTYIGTPIPKTADLGITNSGTPYSDYKNQYPVQSSGQLRAGYMLGFSYNCTSRLLVDVLMQQTPVSTGTNNGPAQSTQYFRLTAGYKLTR